MAMVLCRKGNLHRIKIKVYKNELENTGDNEWQRVLVRSKNSYLHIISTMASAE